MFFNWPSCQFYLKGRLTHVSFHCKERPYRDAYGTCVYMRRKIIHGQWLDWVKLALHYDERGTPLHGFLMTNNYWCNDRLGWTACQKGCAAAIDCIGPKKEKKCSCCGSPKPNPYAKYLIEGLDFASQTRTGPFKHHDIMSELSPLALCRPTWAWYTLRTPNDPHYYVYGQLAAVSQQLAGCQFVALGQQGSYPEKWPQALKIMRKLINNCIFSHPPEPDSRRVVLIYAEIHDQHLEDHRERLLLQKMLQRLGDGLKARPEESRNCQIFRIDGGRCRMKKQVLR
ncbi:unnamed protein product, partial [Mesorhabditis spiculigera]